MFYPIRPQECHPTPPKQAPEARVTLWENIIHREPGFESASLPQSSIWKEAQMICCVRPIVKAPKGMRGGGCLVNDQ